MSAPGQNPYVGLEPFSRQHAKYFFGRALDARIIANNVLTRPITVLFAASGVGKSSVLGAGMPPALEAQFGLVRLASRRVWHSAEDNMKWLSETLTAARGTPSRPLILVCDQFEEYFQHRPKDGTAQFEQELADAIGDSSVATHLLISLREDALYLLDQLRLWLPGILDNTIELEHLDEDGVREAIERPVEVFNEEYTDAGVVLKPGFADDLLADMSGALKGLMSRRHGVSGTFQVELPFLQLALQKLWEQMQRRERKALDGELLRELQGVDGIVRAHLHGRLDALSPGGKLLAIQLFHYLVTPSGGKVAYTAEDLASLATESGGSPLNPAMVQSLLLALSGGQARILRNIGERFELFHDVLARPILDWRASQIDVMPFAYFTEAWTGERIPVAGAGGLVGRIRRSGGTTPLARRSVSRSHFLVMRDGTILDLRSRFGTTINAKPLLFGGRTKLESGDIIGVGNTAALIFERVLDPEPASIGALFDDGADSVSPAWGLLVDGQRRQISHLDADLIYLSLGTDGGVDVGLEAGVENFAVFGRMAGHVFIRSLTADFDLEVLNREDARHNLIRTLKQGEEARVGLFEPEPEQIETMSDLEGAIRSVYRVDGRYFEAILKFADTYKLASRR